MNPQSALRRLREGKCKLQASLDYTARLCLKNPKGGGEKEREREREGGKEGDDTLRREGRRERGREEQHLHVNTFILGL